MNQLKQLRALPLQQGGQIIDFSHDDYGRILVIDDGKQRILNFDSLFEQSCMQLSHPFQLVHQYTRLMALAVAFVDPVHITLLGLGGGSLLRTLHHTLPDCAFHVVELRRAVVEIANEYFLLPQDDRVRITVNDAIQQIAGMETKRSDIIFSDLYDAYRMAPEQVERNFLLECARVLKPEGFLVINLHSRSNDQPGFFEMLGNIFPTVLRAATAENCVLYASRMHPARLQPDPRRLEKMEARLRQRLAQLLARLQLVNVQSKR